MSEDVWTRFFPGWTGFSFSLCVSPVQVKANLETERRTLRRGKAVWSELACVSQIERGRNIQRGHFVHRESSQANRETWMDVYFCTQISKTDGEQTSTD